MFENSPVNYETGQPAIAHARAALEAGMHVSTANKGTVVHGYRELTALAESKGKVFRFESTVLGGTPLFATFREAFPAAELQSFKGIINATTNLILSRMEEGETFDQAVNVPALPDPQHCITRRDRKAPPDCRHPGAGE